MAETRVQIEEVAAPWRFAALAPEWEALAQRSPGTPFLRWSWLFPWWSRLGQGTDPLIAVARDGGGVLRGLLPLYRRNVGPLETWRMLGDRFVGSDGLQPLLERGWEAAAGDALAAWVAESSDRWDMLVLRDVPVGSRWLSVLEGWLGHRSILPTRRPANRCPVVAPAADLARWPRRENFLRRRRWLEQQPSWRITSTTDPSQVQEALGHFLDLHALRWGRRWSDAIAGPAVEGFHREAAAAMSELGVYRLHLMWLSGRPVAGVLGLVDRSAYYYYLPVFDPAWSQRSVGLVLLGMLLEEAAAAGVDRFELLRGEEPYKRELTGAAWSSCTLAAIAPRVAPRAAAAAWSGIRDARALASSAAPERVVGLWRRALGRLSLSSSG